MYYQLHGVLTSAKNLNLNNLSSLQRPHVEDVSLDT